MAKAIFVSGPKHRRVTAPVTRVQFRERQEVNTLRTGDADLRF